MKKILFSLAAVAALVLSSCTKMDNNMNGVYQQSEAIGTEIKVTAMMAGDMQTKAVTNKTTTTDDLKSFYMWGFYGTNKMIMEKEKYSGTKGGSYTASNAYYWPTAQTCEFYATAINNEAGDYNTLDASSMSISQADGIKVTGYEIKVNGQQDDPVYAYTSVDSANKANTDITLTFNHFLARVGVAVAYSSEASKGGLQIRVLGYEFKGVGVKGDAAVKAGTLDWTPVANADGWIKDMKADSWTATSYTTSDGVEPVTETTNWLTTNTKLYRDDSWSNVIPETTASRLVVAVAIFDKNGSYVATRFLGVNLAGSNYTAGNQYIYNVKIVNDGGSTDTDGDNTDGDVYDDKPLTNLAISIVKVTVTPWSTIQGGNTTFGA